MYCETPVPSTGSRWAIEEKQDLKYIDSKTDLWRIVSIIGCIQPQAEDSVLIDS